MKILEIWSGYRKESQKESGNRGEKDADWCRKTYTTTKRDGEKITKTKKWFGFRPKYHDKRIFRIPLKTDPRIFTKVARNSKKWKRLYKKRTSIERVNGRIDRDFQFFDGNVYHPAGIRKGKNRIRDNIKISETLCLSIDM